MDFFPIAWCFADTTWLHARNQRVFVVEEGYVWIGEMGERLEVWLLCFLGWTYLFVKREDEEGEEWNMVESA